MHKITTLQTDCPNNIDCPAVLDVDGDPDWVYIRGDKLTAELDSAIPQQPHEGVIRYPRKLWEERSTR